MAVGLAASVALATIAPSCKAMDEQPHEQPLEAQQFIKGAPGKGVGCVAHTSLPRLERQVRSTQAEAEGQVTKHITTRQVNNNI